MNRPKILLLHDLKSFPQQQLQNVLTLARKMDAHLTMLHVRVPLKVVRVDNQYSAKRELYEDYRTTIKQMGELCPTEETKNKSIDREVLYGNLKGCILERMAELQPDMVIMGEPRKKSFPFLGQNLQSLLRKHTSCLVMANNQGGLVAFNNFSVPTNRTTDTSNISVADLAAVYKLPFTVDIIRPKKEKRGLTV